MLRDYSGINCFELAKKTTHFQFSQRNLMCRTRPTLINMNKIWFKMKFFIILAAYIHTHIRMARK